MLYHTAQDCLRAVSDGGDSVPSFSDPGKNAPRIQPNPVQAIITSYEFHCCGIIAGWAAFVEPGGGKHNGRNSGVGAYSVTFQVWRPTPSDGNRYVKVGESQFENVILDPNSEINEELSSNERLHFQPEDVIGYYLEQNGPDDETNGGLQFDSDFSQETMYYATGNADLQTECLLEVGSTGDLSMSTNLGPIISLSFSESLLYYIMCYVLETQNGLSCGIT